MLEGPLSTAKLVLTAAVAPANYTGSALSLYADPRFSHAPSKVPSLRFVSLLCSRARSFSAATVVQRLASDLDCEDILWLEGQERRLAETADKNVFLLWKAKDGGA